MIRCNGFCSGGRAISARRTPAGEPLLLHHAGCSAAWRTRGALLRCIREYCGDVDITALAKLAALPSYHAMQIPPGTPGPEGAL